MDGPHADALVITLDVADCEVSRILVDNESDVDVIFEDTLLRMGIDRRKFGTSDIKLTGFNGKTSSAKGSIKLSIWAAGICQMVDFKILDCLTPFNMILGKPWIHSMKVIPSSYCQCIHFPSPDGVKEII